MSVTQDNLLVSTFLPWCRGMRGRGPGGSVGSTPSPPWLPRRAGYYELRAPHEQSGPLTLTGRCRARPLRARRRASAPCIRRLATTCVTAAQFGTVAYGVVALWSLAAAFSTDDEAWDATDDDGATRLQLFRTAGVAAALSAARGLLWETDPSDALVLSS